MAQADLRNVRLLAHDDFGATGNIGEGVSLLRRSQQSRKIRQSVSI